MSGSGNTIIKYFGWGTNADLDMMSHMVGNRNIKGTPAKLLGYEACVQKSRDMRTEIPQSSPLKITPREIIVDVWGPDFDMYVTRPNSDASITGIIWDLTPLEMELVKEWECVKYGLQDEVRALAVDSSGNKVEVEIQTLSRHTDKIDRVINGDRYELYIAPKADMLRKADSVRVNFLKQETL